MNVARANANHPNLSIGITRFEAITSSNFAFANLKVSCFKRDHHNFAVIPWLYLRFDLGFVEIITSPLPILLCCSGVGVLSSFQLLVRLWLHFNWLEEAKIRAC
jgi:hypothetical protein